MGVFTFQSEETSPIAAATWFKALVLQNVELFPKVAPEFIKSVEVLQGDGGSGSIQKVTSCAGGKLSYERHEIEEVDKVNLKIKYSVIEGEILEDKLEKISYDLTFVPSPDGGTIGKSITKFYTKADFEVTEEQFKAVQEKSKALVKAVEAYLLANPDF